MKQLSIKIKLIGIFVVMGFLLMLMGLVGYWVANNLSIGLNNITGPVWNASKGVSQGVEGVNQQLLIVEQSLRSGLRVDREKLKTAETKTLAAFEQIVSSNKVGLARIQELEKSMKQFHTSRESVLAANRQYLEVQPKLANNISEFRDILNRVELIASQNMLTREINLEDSENDDTEPSEQPYLLDESIEDDNSESDEFEPEDTEQAETTEEDESIAADKDVINAVSSGHLALLERLYLLKLWQDDPKNHEVMNEMESYFGDLGFTVDTVDEYLNGDKVIRGTVFAGMTHKQALKKALLENKTQTTETMQSYTNLTAQLANYRNDADVLIKQGSMMTTEIKAQVDNEKNDLNTTVTTGFYTLFGTVILGFLVTIPIYLLSMRTVVKPLNEVSIKLWDMAEGEGDLTVKLPTNGDKELANLSSAFNAFTEKLANTIASLQATIKQLSSTTIHITTVGNRTENAVDKQQGQIDAMVATLGELSNNIQSVAASTEQAHDNAQTVDARAREGKDIVMQTIDSIQGVATEVEKASGVINKLGEKSKRISNVLNVIQEISEQTNLLALNAAIEAARAGESGRGFAVVADEVRNLASRTKDAITQIHGTIQELQEGAGAAIQVIEQASHRTRETVEPANQAGVALQEITSLVTGIAELNAQVATATKEQSDSATNIQQNSMEIRDGANATSFSAKQLSDSTTDLVEIAEKLSNLANQFTIHPDLEIAANDKAHEDEVELW